MKYKNTIYEANPNNNKWLVLDIDECLYPPKFDDNSEFFASTFVTIEKEFSKKYLNLIKKNTCKIKNIHTNCDIKNLFNLRKYLGDITKSHARIIGLFITLKELNIYVPVNEYHCAISKNFRYDKIEKNENIINAIQTAKCNNMKCAIFSNASYFHIMKCLQRLELNIKLFDYISCLNFVSDNVIMERKPNLYSFKKFQNEINAKPENIFFFDNSINNCISAFHLRWNAILVNTNIPKNVMYHKCTIKIKPVKNTIDILTNTNKNKCIYQIDSISNINFIIN